MREFPNAAAILGAWLSEQGICAAELSRRTQIDAGILRDILCGRKKSISTRNLLALAHYFGMSMQELMDKLAEPCAL